MFFLFFSEVSAVANRRSKLYQQVTLIGNLGNDPEMRYMADGTAVTNFSLATTRRWKTSEGERREETTWWRISAWRGLAETCNQYLTKGRQVQVVGRMIADENGSPKTFTRQDGSVGASFELVAKEVNFLGSPGAPASSSNGVVQAVNVAPQEADDIPF